MPRVEVISLGGTIASLPERRERQGPAVPQLDAGDLVAALPGIADIAQVASRAFRREASCNLRFEDLLELHAAIGSAFADGCDGVVITQGTDTLEETAFFADLLHGGPQPLVFTGAMRPAAAPGADGPANLAAAIAVAAAHEARELGAVVVMADQVHAARWAAKRHTARVTAFESPTAGPLGWLSEGQARIALRPARRPPLPAPPPSALPPVATVAIGLGDDGRLLAAVPELGYAGLVVEALGGGHVPAATMDALVAVATRIPVVIASRTGAGELLRTTYGYPGSEVDLLARGMLSAGTLNAAKARLLLILLLATRPPREQLLSDFARYAAPSPAGSG